MEKKPFNFPCCSKPPTQKALTNPKVKSYTLIDGGNRASLKGFQLFAEPNHEKKALVYYFPLFPTCLNLEIYSKICGYTVCGDCSQERVKDRRACDICVWRLRNKPGEDLREEFLVNYEEAVNHGSQDR